MRKKTREESYADDLLKMLELLLSITEEAKDALSPTRRDTWLALSAKVADARLMLDKGKL